MQEKAVTAFDDIGTLASFIRSRTHAHTHHAPRTQTHSCRYALTRMHTLSRAYARTLTHSHTRTQLQTHSVHYLQADAVRARLTAIVGAAVRPGRLSWGGDMTSGNLEIMGLDVGIQC
jgi:CII-binding regulator of phage lambda lysogenization HflD